MTPSAYSKALAQLEAGALPERRVGDLNAAAVDRLRAIGYPAAQADTLAAALNTYWWAEVEERKAKAEARAIVAAVTRLVDVLERSPRWAPNLRLPDAAIWGEAGATILPNSVPTMGLGRYLKALRASLASDDAAGSVPMWGRRSIDDRRRSGLPQFVIRCVAGAMPEESNRPGATSGQKRYGRNAAIARACSALLARPITRQTVAQTLKKTV